MAIITAIVGALGLKSGSRRPAIAASLEWLGGLVLVAGFVTLGFGLARVAG